jgi:hypothetical protein
VGSERENGPGCVGYGDGADAGAVIRHGVSSAILLMGWPSAMWVRMSLR